jgi:hypothetical protein
MTKTVEDILTEAKEYGESANIVQNSGHIRQAVDLKLKEIELLESARRQFTEDGRLPAHIGEAYATISRILYRAGNNIEGLDSDYYLYEARKTFSSLFDNNNSKFPKYAYYSYSFVLYRLAQNTKDFTEKRMLLTEHVKVMEHAVEKNHYRQHYEKWLRKVKEELASMEQQKAL